jgi:dTDP-4-dehydrorhamnose reductase
MKVLVFGCNGQLGRSLASATPAGFELIGFDLPALDISNNEAVVDIVRENSPDLIVNAAAYTAVDKAESEPETAASINVDGTRHIAAAANAVGAKFIHISTDYVFDGESTEPYRPDAVTNPLGVYGQTKRDGELAALEETSGAATVIRTAWLYSKTGNNFVKTMLRLMDERDELNVVADQIGSPTWADSLAAAVWAFSCAPQLQGIYHWTDEGVTSWHGFAVTIQTEALALGLLKKSIPINAVGTKDYPTATKRPMYTVLDCSATHNAINIRPAKWQANLRRVLEEMARLRELGE